MQRDRLRPRLPSPVPHTHMTCNHRTAPGSTPFVCSPQFALVLLAWARMPDAIAMASLRGPSWLLPFSVATMGGPNFSLTDSTAQACAVTTVSTVSTVSRASRGPICLVNRLPRLPYQTMYLPTCLHYTTLHWTTCTTCNCPASRLALNFLPHIARTSVISGPNFRPTAHITISPYSPAYRFLNHLVRPPSLPIPALATIPVCLDRCNQPATCCFFLLFHPSSSRGSSPPGLNPRLGVSVPPSRPAGHLALLALPCPAAHRLDPNERRHRLQV